MKAWPPIEAQDRTTMGTGPPGDEAIGRDTPTPDLVNGQPRLVSRRHLDLLVCFLCMIIVTCATGLLLDQAGIGRLAYHPGFSTSSNGELSALFEAIAENDMAAARRVLQKRRFDVNATGDVLSVPPISLALSARGAGANELVDLLIAAGADVNGRGSDGRATPPLMAAVNLHRPDLVKQLLEAGADVDGAMRNGWTALHFAAAYDDPETVAVLLAAGADPDAVDDEGDTALAVALADGSLAAVASLSVDCPKSNLNRAKTKP
jgi:hypothetical protein